MLLGQLNHHHALLENRGEQHPPLATRARPTVPKLDAHAPAAPGTRLEHPDAAAASCAVVTGHSAVSGRPHHARDHGLAHLGQEVFAARDSPEARVRNGRRDSGKLTSQSGRAHAAQHHEPDLKTEPTDGGRAAEDRHAGNEADCAEPGPTEHPEVSAAAFNLNAMTLKCG